METPLLMKITQYIYGTPHHAILIDLVRGINANKPGVPLVPGVERSAMGKTYSQVLVRCRLLVCQ